MTIGNRYNLCHGCVTIEHSNRFPASNRPKVLTQSGFEIGDSDLLHDQILTRNSQHVNAGQAVTWLARIGSMRAASRNGEVNRLWVRAGDGEAFAVTDGTTGEWRPHALAASKTHLYFTVRKDVGDIWVMDVIAADKR